MKKKPSQIVLLIIVAVAAAFPTIFYQAYEHYIKPKSSEAAGLRVNNFIVLYAQKDFLNASGQLCPWASRLLSYNEPDGSIGALRQSWDSKFIPAKGGWDVSEWRYERLISKDTYNADGEPLKPITVRLDYVGNDLLVYQRLDPSYWCISGYEGETLDFLAIR